MKKYKRSQTKVCKNVVSGAGSLFGEAEALYYAGIGDFAQAVEIITDHNRQLPPRSRRIPEGIVNEWRRYATNR